MIYLSKADKQLYILLKMYKSIIFLNDYLPIIYKHKKQNDFGLTILIEKRQDWERI